ncbi:BolA family protein [Kushneria indalinina]|uniref:Acid stress-induced BolA-like protein IbaG/YrbA n=1 Tax=Kushneria indalinina DSM 14324 TaxID=1122140 RepID=A0A3D9E1Y5_9GAMM|nr:BolA family protein [Kushneria indalinina]REC96539.1 acid stress-induced BolA-like protein IbaG/YrbA [Kushneria indalinina DSM 14324]
MQPEEVKHLLQARIDGCEFHIQGEGCNFQVTAIGDVFEGMSPVKRQQLIYSALSEEIASGALHAITIKARTPAQWASASPDSDRA